MFNHLIGRPKNWLYTSAAAAPDIVNEAVLAPLFDTLDILVQMATNFAYSAERFADLAIEAANINNSALATTAAEEAARAANRALEISQDAYRRAVAANQAINPMSPQGAISGSNILAIANQAVLRAKIAAEGARLAQNSTIKTN